jgi:protein-tyrosine phosphatase
MKWIYDYENGSIYVGNYVDGQHVPDDMVVLDVRHMRFLRCPNDIDIQKHNLRICEEMDKKITESLKAGKNVLVHCMVGEERSPFVIVFWLASHTQMTWDEAYDHVMRENFGTKRHDEFIPKEARSLRIYL